MNVSRGRALRVLVPVLVLGLAAACAGCSWLVGVSEDPVVVDPAGGDGGVGGAAAGPDGTVNGADAALDAPDDV